MKNLIPLILYYNRFNRYGFNSLLGALETDSYFDELPVFFVCRDSEWNNIKEIVEENDLTIVAFSFTTPQIFEIANIVTFLRKACGKKIFLIAGGPHPSGDPAGTLQMGFDAVFIGEGEKSFPLFLKAMLCSEIQAYPNELRQLFYVRKPNIYFFLEEILKDQLI